MIDWISIADIGAASLVVIALVFRFKNRGLWFIYAVGCLTYAVINIYKDLPGQAVMNIIAGAIATWHTTFWPVAVVSSEETVPKA